MSEDKPGTWEEAGLTVHTIEDSDVHWHYQVLLRGAWLVYDSRSELAFFPTHHDAYRAGATKAAAIFADDRYWEKEGTEQ